MSLNNGLATIGDGAFGHCSSLPTIGLPDSVSSIGSRAFSGCTSLTNIVIGTGLSSIGSTPFQQCDALLAIDVAPGNASYSSVDGVLFDKNQATLLMYPSGKRGTYVVPGSVTSIAYLAFGYCARLSGIDLSQRVLNVGSQAFWDCTGLTNLVLGNNLTNIEFEAFAYCSSLASLKVPDSLTIINYGAFWQCTSLATVAFGNGLKNIGPAAFSSCHSLTNIYIPDNVTIISSESFFDCSNLTSVTIGRGLNSVIDGAFYWCPNLTGIYFAGNAPAYSEPHDPVFSDHTVLYYNPAASGWTSPFAGRPALPIGMKIQVGDGSFGVRTNQFGFNITGSYGLTVVVEAATDLVNPAWVPAQTNTLTGGTSYFFDPDWKSFPKRSYRVRWP